jgi:lysophospholipase L1-like esterase
VADWESGERIRQSFVIGGKMRIFGALVVWTLIAVGGQKTFGAGGFQKEIDAFVASDKTNPPPKNAVLFVGSSSIRMWTNLAEAFPNIKTINRGFGGSQISDVIEYADKIVIPYHPSKIVFYAGDNDIAAGKSPEKVSEDFKTFVEKVRAELPNVPIYFLAIKPSPSRWHLAPKSETANNLIRQFAKQSKNLHYIDVASPLLNSKGEPDPDLFKADKLHLNSKGYVIWAKVVNAGLNER